MGLITKPKTFTEEVLYPADLNENFDEIYDEVNGSLNADNLAANAVTTAKIADDAVTLPKIINNYRASAFRSTTQNIVNGDTAGEWATVIFNSEEYDLNNNFNTTTGQYTAPVTGFYSFTYNIGLNHSAGGGQNFRVRVLKNNSTAKYYAHSIVTSVDGLSDISLSGSGQVYMTVGDTLRVDAYLGHAAGGQASVVGSAAALTNFSVHCTGV